MMTTTGPGNDAPPTTAAAVSAENQKEHYTHWLAHEAQVVLRAAVLILVGVTVVTMVTFWFWAIIPAVLLLVCYIALLMVNAVERSSDHLHQDETREGFTHSDHPVMSDDDVHEMPKAQDATESRILLRESKLFTCILLGLGVVAFVLTAIFLPPGWFAMAWMVFFAYMVLVMAPVWLGWIEDDIEHEKEQA